MLNKKNNALNLTKDLEQIKALVIGLYKLDRTTISRSALKDLDQICVENMVQNLSKKEINEWQKINALLGKNSYAEYLSKISELQMRERENTFTEYLHSIKPIERKLHKKYYWYWVNFTSNFFTSINDVKTINLLLKHHEIEHFKNKANKIINDDPLIWSLKEEIRFDLSALLRQRLFQITKKSSGGISGIVVNTLQSKIRPEEWISMMKDLAQGNYIAKEYLQDDDLIRIWIGNALRFDNKKVNAVVNDYFEKLKWKGSAMALAKWLMQLKFSNALIKAGDNSLIIYWIENFIAYPGTRKALIVALSNCRKYSTEFFEIKNNSTLGFSFRVLLSSRASKK